MMRAALVLGLGLAACGGHTISAATDGARLGDASAASDSTAAADAAATTGFVHVQQGVLVDGTNAPLRLRCVNLGGWLDPEPYLVGSNAIGLLRSPTELRDQLATLVGQTAGDQFWQDWEAAFVTEADFAQIAALGFNCARLPINHRRIADVGNTTVTLDPLGMAPIDHAVAWGQAHHVYVAIDLHAAPGGQNNVSTVSDVPSTDTTPRLWVAPDATANQAELVEIWRQLAARYASSPSVLGYDLLNEPDLPTGVDPQALAELYARIATAIRASDPNHALLVEGNAFAHDFSTLTPPLDANQVYEFHAYSSATGWATPNAASLAPYLALAQAQDRPLWLGEFGEDTLAWQQSVVSVVEAGQVGWAVWPWKRRPVSGHPALETIATPAAWETLFSYLVAPGSNAAPADPMAAMQAMLTSVTLASCAEDSTLAATLTP